MKVSYYFLRVIFKISKVFEKDPIKYAKYREAARLAMIDKHQEEGMDSVTVAVVGAGRGPLVYETLKAAEEANIKVINTVNQRMLISGVDQIVCSGEEPLRSLHHSTTKRKRVGRRG